MSALMDRLSFFVSKKHSDDTKLSGAVYARTPLLNKSTAFTAEERETHDLEGLFPSGDPQTLELKVTNLIAILDTKSNPLEKYVYLHTIQDADETLFYAALCSHTADIMPLVYTPTVGEACQRWSHIYRGTPRGLYVSLKYKGSIRKLLHNQPNKEIKVIVLTDGERILGLGDLGVNGMGIPIGKLALYTACAGIHPKYCLPVHIDVGTNTTSLLEDPMYLGLRHARDRSEAYDELIDEFFAACQEVYGKHVLLQFEDFGNFNASRLLEKYRHRACTFNDDIQGTAAVALSGIIASLPLTKKTLLIEHTFLFFGAGEAGIGIADLLSSAISLQSKIPLEEARKKVWLVDSKGLVTSARGDELQAQKRPYAHSVEQEADDSSLLAAIERVAPTALIGVSAQGGSFKKECIEALAKNCEVPVIFALSNPTSKSECTATEAYEWTNGNCVFASGSPFAPVALDDGRFFIPGQGNNAFIFPGIGLAAIATGATSITDDDFYVAASCLASLVPSELLSAGCVYPSLDTIRDVSLKIAATVAMKIFAAGRGSLSRPSNVTEYCANLMYSPKY